MCVPVEMTGGLVGDELLMVDPNPLLDTDGIQMSPALIKQGEAKVMVSNPTGFTCHLEGGHDLGTLDPSVQK